MSTIVLEMNPYEVIRTYRDGDLITWKVELGFLWQEHTEKMLELLASVMVEGFKEPITIGNDGRIWDGHHRIGVALALGIDVPVIFA